MLLELRLKYMHQTNDVRGRASLLGSRTQVVSEDIWGVMERK